MQTESRKDFDVDRLLHPAGAFRTPMEVVNDPDMTVQQKRAILASWASDACAVEAAPDLRQPPSAPVVRFDTIMDALKRLDGEAAAKPTYGKFINRARRWKDLYRGDRAGRPLFAWGAAMMKLVFAAALAAVLCAPDAAARSLLQRSDWPDRNFETHLPRVDTTVPWLDWNTRTRTPKGDIPLGRDAASVGGFVLPSRPDMQVSTNSFSAPGRM